MFENIVVALDLLSLFLALVVVRLCYRHLFVVVVDALNVGKGER